LGIPIAITVAARHITIAILTAGYAPFAYLSESMGADPIATFGRCAAKSVAKSVVNLVAIVAEVSEGVAYSYEKG
jgi:hypothetical protein